LGDAVIINVDDSETRCRSISVVELTAAVNIQSTTIYQDRMDEIVFSSLAAEAADMFPCNPLGREPAVIRRDAYGAGDFGADRTRTQTDGTKIRYKHKGVDYSVLPAASIYAPISGTVRVGNCYRGNNFFKLVEILGVIYCCRILYVEPFLQVKNGATVKRGDLIGAAQAISKKYDGMHDHIHFEVAVLKDMTLGNEDIHINPDIFAPAWKL
jgi:murein DD-endopeptidase MepM/ murein hydrolase activator NlpD